MRIVSTNFIPDRSRPGLTTTAIGAIDLQGAGGNWATVGGRSRGGRRVHRQREKRKGKSVGLRIGTLNVGTMTGKGRELADMMERRKVDILCVQEIRWKGSKARSIRAGFKLFYYGVDSKRNGIGVVLKEEFVRNVLEVKRVSDRVMSLKVEIEGVMLNVVSGYAPQVGCELEEKERFWSELDEVMESIPTGERVVIGADFNGHVGEGNTGDEEVMGKFGVKERNLEGQMVVDFAKRMDMAVVNTYFQKREEHRVTYKSGGRRTQVDYILCRRGNLKEISDCKVVVGESVARQHRMVVCRMTLMVCKKKRSKIEKKTKWWKLKKEECCEEFRQKLRQALGGQVVLPDDWETTAEVIRETGRKVLGVSSGRRKEDKETWWWNEEVQDSIQRKRLAKKKWDMDRTEENRQEYKELQRRVKREVSKAKQKAYDELYTRLDTREGEKDLYRLARQRDRDGKHVQQVRVIKDRDGRVLTSEESVQRRWKEYFEDLMNEENEREKRVEGVNSVEQKVDKIRKDEVRKALKRMKSGKAVGPDDIPVEVWKCLGEAAVEFLTSLFNRVLESERMSEEWRSVLVPIFKNKGDVQSCSNYRGIKLMSHTMKLWERVVEARLRKVVEICEQQYGFMPRKSTTDAIFALRILMEKYRDGQRELHCVFVDLEKAYDRVPREELWYCMRKSGVAEKYVRVVQDMYERSRTVVRCAVGQTEEFNVEVGLHQGSALSPFLFAIVMDQLSEEVRQESPWTMMFADDIVICSESREQVEENLERWRFALERRGMKVSGSKTEYMCVNEREGSGTVRLQGEEVKKVQEFKYLGSTVQSNGECGKELRVGSVISSRTPPAVTEGLAQTEQIQREASARRFRWGASPHNVASVSGRCPACRQRRRVLATPCSHPPAPWGVPDPSETDIIALEPSFVGGRRSVRVLGGGRRSDLLLGGGRHSELLLGGGRRLALLLGCGRHSALLLGCGRRVGPFGLAVLLKCADDTTVIGLIQDGDESAYRREVEQLAAWCSLNNLELNTLKTVEMIVDFRRNTPALPPLTIMNSTVPTVESFRFLGTTISQDLRWDTHIDSIIKKVQQTLYFLRQLRKFNLPQELLTHFYSAVIESVLCTSITVWFGSATKSDIGRLQRTVRTAKRIIGAPLPTLQELYTSRVRKRAQKTTLDPSHPGHLLFELLPSRRRYRAANTRTGTRTVSSPKQSTF
ncbi:hypothetical protein QTP70_011009 [Hemibagrus guttatus]|uniref:ribonuclease H n=1 Tax=Hemibagrus guttatus TaxID=175788 RepID=A0AAE0PVF5_9TELE|nr:hypothetical protein QTP70_011009 [Hemibagrus guttatus]